MNYELLLSLFLSIHVFLYLFLFFIFVTNNKGADVEEIGIEMELLSEGSATPGVCPVSVIFILQSSFRRDRVSIRFVIVIVLCSWVRHIGLSVPLMRWGGVG